MDYNHIIGHERIKTEIINSIRLGMLSHAHLFVGEDGIGKSLIAKAMAISILGKEKVGQYADIIEFSIDKGRKTIGVETIRNIVEEVNKKPYEGDRKVVIVYNADKMTTEAQNAFLKTIEEPPKGVFIILLCEDSEAVLDTIKSRCQVHKLQRLRIEEVVQYLRKYYPKLSDEEIKTISAFSDGIPGRGERLINDTSFREIRDMVLKILSQISGYNENGAVSYGAFFEKHKKNWQEIITWILSYVRDIMVYKETGKENMIINIDKYEDIKDLANRFSFNKLNDIISIVNDTQIKLIRNVNSALVFDVMILNMQEA